MYHDTTHLSFQALQDAVAKAKKQDEVIFLMFRRYRTLSPSQVLDTLEANGYNWPLTSVRRSITNLTTKGHLRKTRIKGLGNYGREEYKWTVA